MGAWEDAFSSTSTSNPDVTHPPGALQPFHQLLHGGGCTEMSTGRFIKDTYRVKKKSGNEYAYIKGTSFFIYFTSQPVSPPSSLPVLSPFSSPLLPQSTPSLFLFRKGQASRGYHQSMIYQVKVRLRTSPCIMVGQGSPV